MSEQVNTDLFGNVVLSDKENVYVQKKQKDLSSETTTEYLIEVIVKDEREQEAMYNELTQKGHKCRVLTL